MKQPLLLLLIGGLVLAACGGPSKPLPSPRSTQPPTPAPAPSFSDLIITLEREMCNGTCPVYKLTIQGDGTLTYEGEAYVTVEGVQTSQLGPDQVAQLVAAFEEARFFNLDDHYFYGASDLPSTNISITMNGRTKVVNHYGACGDPQFDNAPPELCILEEKIDLLTNSAQWTGQ